MQMSGEL